MKISKTFAFFCALLLSSVLAFPLRAQTDSTRVRGIQYSSAEAERLRLEAAPRGVQGFAVSVDLLGPVLAAVSSYGQYEAAVRMNIAQRFFPTIEAGWGVCNKTDDNTDLHFKTKAAPFIRVGCDYNFLNDVRSGHTLLGGLRLGYSTFKYDLSGKNLDDPYWNTSTPFQFESKSSNALWLELAAGVETAVWKRVHLGWSVRYRRRISHTTSTPGQAWYIPGFGKNDIGVFSGMFNVVLVI